VLQGTECLPPSCDIGIRQSQANTATPVTLYGVYNDHGGASDLQQPDPYRLVCHDLWRIQPKL